MSAQINYINNVSLESSLVLVTPQLADEWLKKNVKNRNVSIRSVDSLARDIAAGRWQITHQGIGFYTDGSLADGQHRLLAIKKAGIPVYVFVTFGIQKESLTAIDQHRMRKTDDVIKLTGKHDWITKEDIAIVRIFMSMISWSDSGTKTTSPILSASLIMEKSEIIKERLLFARNLSSGTRVKGVTVAAASAAFATAYGYEDVNRLIEFSDVIKSGMTTGPGDVAAIRLREVAMSGKISSNGEGARRAFLRRTQRAIKAFCNKESIKKLVEPTSLIYPIPEEIAL
jgi:hypothetical protein